MTITVNMSLFLQAYTVCKGFDDIYRYTMTAVSGIVALLAISFRFATTVINIQTILSATSFLSMAWLMEGTLVTETISIWYFSIIFTGKLVWTLWNRRRNGWKQWSAVRILATMGGCTMVIPSIFAILEYTTPDALPEAGTLALTMVALLLPLSSLWAGMATDEETSSLNLPHLAASNQISGSRTNYQQKNSGGSSNAPSSQLFLQSRKGSDAIQPATMIDSVVKSQGRDSTEMDLEAMGVRVNKSYGFQPA
ncbi:pheromone alpha factor receptor [Clarireedia jacksonii]